MCIMTSRVYELMEELSSPTIGIVPSENVVDMNEELMELLKRGETEGNFRSSILDQYYAEYAKASIRYCKNRPKQCVKVSDSPYYGVLEILLKRYMVDPDNYDEKGKTPVEYAAKLKCHKFVEYLISNGSNGPPKKKTPKKKAPKKQTPKKKDQKKQTPKKKTPKKKSTTKKCDLRATTNRCVNGTKQSRKCYRNEKTKRCRRKR